MLRDPALILVDIQNDFVKDGYAHDVHPGYDTTATETDDELASPQAAASNAASFVERYRESGRSPIFVRTHHNEGTMSENWAAKYEDRPTPCVPNTEGVEFVSELNVTDDDITITKNRYSAFDNTNLETYLDSKGISQLLVGGVSTNVCVESTVRAAFDKNYFVTVLSDCTASTELDRHRAALENIESHFGDVRESTEIEL